MYTSSCIVENKHFEVEENKVESYEDFIANLPLPIEELNHKTVRKYDLWTYFYELPLLFLTKISPKVTSYVSRGYYVIAICTFTTKSRPHKTSSKNRVKKVIFCKELWCGLH